MAELIQRGGPTLLMILALVLPALVMVILHVVLARAWSAWISTGLLAVILAIGLYGTLTARSLSNQALEAIIDRADREAFRAEAYAEAGLPVKAAALVNGLLAIGVVIGELRRRRR
jgi:hypothetical protein